jgi:formamidopyrimidine-DNA glycosylase
MGIFTSKHIGVALEELAKAISQLSPEEQRQRVESLLKSLNTMNQSNGIDERLTLFPKFEKEKCKQCGNPLPYSRSRGNKRQFCSDKCRVAHHAATAKS